MIEAGDTSELRRALVEELVESGSLRDPRWTTAFENVPRHVFVPRFFARGPGGRFQPVDGYGEARGHFMPYFGGFMPTRAYHRVPPAEMLEARRPQAGIERPATISATALTDDAFGMFAALRVEAEQVWLRPDDDPEQFWLVDGTGSWAYQTTDGDGDPVAVQGGAAELWDELENAHADWLALGRPPRESFGLTVTSDGTHRIWHESPTGPSWPLTTTQ